MNRKDILTSQQRIVEHIKGGVVGFLGGVALFGTMALIITGGADLNVELTGNQEVDVVTAKRVEFLKAMEVSNFAGTVIMCLAVGMSAM